MNLFEVLMVLIGSGTLLIGLLALIVDINNKK